MRQLWERITGRAAAHAWWSRELARTAPRQPHDGQTADARKTREAAAQADTLPVCPGRVHV